MTFSCYKNATSPHGNEQKENMYLPGRRQVTFLVYAIHALPHLVFAADITFHVREHTGLMCPQVILGAEEQHGELADVMFHFLDVDRNCPRMANLSWPPPATQGKADETSGFLTDNHLRSMLLCGDTGKKCMRATSKAGGETRGYWRWKHALYQPLNACKKARDCCTVPCREEQLLTSVAMSTA